MANPTWPAGLPAPARDSGDYAPAVDNILSTPMEMGAPKRRVHFTYVPDNFTGTLKLTREQTLILDDFYLNVLKQIGRFDWVHWRTGATVTYTFRSRPKYTLIVDSYPIRWSTTLELMTV